MRVILIQSIIFFFIIGCLLFAADDVIDIDKQVKDWKLNDTDNKSQSFKKLSEDKEIVVLIFLATQCPVVDEYTERIVTLTKEYKEKEVQFIGIYSNKYEKIDEIKKYSEKHKLEFPSLIDPENKLADYFQARRTPEVFLIDTEKKLRYRGAIDNNRKTPEIHYLKDVLNLKLEGKTIPDKQKKTKAVGCTIKRVRKTDIDRTP